MATNFFKEGESRLQYQPKTPNYFEGVRKEKPLNNPLEQIKQSNEETQQIINDNQQRVNDYYRRLNGNLSREDMSSILNGRVSKTDYQGYMDNAKQYMAGQQKPDLTNLAAFQQAMWDRQEARNELDRLNEERRVQNERLGRSIGEFAAMFGDLAKAHGGAIVTPRNFDQQLQQLGERERNAYKLYTANQQRIDQDRLAEAVRQEQLKIQADARKQAQDNADRAFDEGVRQFNEEMAYKKDRDAKNRANKLAVANAKKANNENKNLSYIAWNGNYYAYNKELAKTKAEEFVSKYWDKVGKDLIQMNVGVQIGDRGPVFGNGVKWNEVLAVCIDTLNKEGTEWTDSDIEWIQDWLNKGNVYGQEQSYTPTKPKQSVKTNRWS